MIKAVLGRELRVRDVMTAEVVFVRAQHLLDEAWATLHAREISGAPVLNRYGELVGIVSKADLADPRRRGPGATVAEAMTRVVYAVRESDSVMTAVRLMLSQKIHRALVVRQDGTLAGIVAPLDILQALTWVDAPGNEVEYVELPQRSE